MNTRCMAVAVLLLALVAPVLAQAPDGNAVLRGAGVDVPRRGGAAAAFDLGMTGPTPVPPTALTTLIIGMGPVGNTARIRNAYAFGVLAGRSARPVPAGQLAGAGVALLQMVVAPHRPTRIAGTRVAGRVFAAPVDGGSPPLRPDGLVQGLVLLLNAEDANERMAAIEALGLLHEVAAVPTLVDTYTRARGRNDRRMAGAALEALARMGDERAAALAAELPADAWSQRDDETGLIWAFARERFLKDGSANRLRAAIDHRTLGPRARDYLLELGQQP